MFFNYYLCSYVEIKKEIKTEDESENQHQDPPGSEQQDAAGHTHEVKMEDKGSVSRKRPHEDNRGHNHHGREKSLPEKR